MLKINGDVIMKFFKISSLFFIILFIIGDLFLFFRKTDGSGIENNFANQVVSLMILGALFLIILIVHIIVYHNIKR
ncbi:DUF3923 family protein [Apilactobacillus timberlakei]|nr:DUF3923 family protein [Apilactobacillus timberlakei]